MKQYRVVTTCVGMPFDKRYFEKGEVIEVDDDVDPKSDCFELVGKAEHVKVAPEVQSAETYKGIQEKNKEATSPKKGFAASLNTPVPGAAPRATRIKKSR